jgi:tetratricopeptide (TPR) repeat protein
VLAETGKPDEALSHLSRALQINPNYGPAHYNLANVLVSQAREAEAVAHYRSALKLSPEWPPALSALAWLLATSRDQRIRGPAESLALAEHAVALTNRRDAAALDALGAAYAAAGRFDEAVASVRAAIDLATRRGAGGAAEDAARRLALYEQRRAYTDTAGNGPIRP